MLVPRIAARSRRKNVVVLHGVDFGHQRIEEMQKPNIA